MYLAHYGLKLKPFSISPDPNFLWLGERHKEALAALKYGILDNKGFLLLTGDVGTGKTVLINSLIKIIDLKVIVATIPDPGLSLTDFYNILADEFKMGRTFNQKSEFLIYFKEFLLRAYGDEKTVLLIIDEAQRLEHKLLEEVRVLSNIDFNGSKLINIFLVGQNELREMLMEERNRPFRQRISVNYNIEALNEEETASFIEHRLKVAGATRKYFTPDAISQVYLFSQGFPRLINIICDNALLSGYSAGVEMIDAGIIQECAKELRISVDVPTPTLTEITQIGSTLSSQQTEADEYQKESKISEKRPLLVIAGFLVILIIFIGFIISFFKTSQSEKSPEFAKHDNKLAIEQNSTGNEKKQPTEIAASNENTNRLPLNSPQSEDLEKVNNAENIEVDLKKSDKGQAETRTDSMRKDETLAAQMSKAESDEDKEALTEEGTPEPQAADQNTPQQVDKDSEEIKAESMAIDKASIDQLSEAESAEDKEALIEEGTPGLQAANQSDQFQEQQRHLLLQGKKFLVSFKSNSTEIDSKDLETLAKIAKYLSQYSNYIAIVEGYTDSYGNYFYNLKLSQLRANMVKNYFVGQGIEISRIKAVGLGSENPIADNENQKGRSKNRRVEIRFEIATQGSAIN